MMKKLLCILLALLCIAASAQASARWPVVITDHAGRSVTIESEPESIVSGYYITTSMLIGLDKDDLLVGIENAADTRSIYALSAPHLLNLPGMGTMKLFDLEACAALNPDLIILPMKQKDMAGPLEELGFTVLFVNPESQDLLRETISILGAATGCADRADAMIAHIDGALAQLAAALEAEEKPSVYLASNSSLLRTTTPAMYQNSLIENAGGANAACDINDTYWAEVSYEQVLAWDPDFIILAANADYGVESVMNDVNLSACSAVAAQNVYQLPSMIESWDSPVPASFLGSLYLASVLHPECYSEADYLSATQDFYETFYGFTPDL